ncbi:hypothetical protein BV22DRAFT_902777 [Leucogyrophana mollusca]|uniref:Uncharacterized protein n=1 Tax=Leucogyrophana mollusca TaxID=85980 RepID=A0ACB8AYJ5_9AGAM|nr:hypothetical protein BV22DRAFT_902777 [Leucogyrophana mollusca]
MSTHDVVHVTLGPLETLGYLDVDTRHPRQQHLVPSSATPRTLVSNTSYPPCYTRLPERQLMCWTSSNLSAVRHNRPRPMLDARGRSSTIKTRGCRR